MEYPRMSDDLPYTIKVFNYILSSTNKGRQLRFLW